MAGPTRQHPRYAHHAAVTLHVAGEARAGLTQNVSRGGLCADLAQPIQTGTDIDIDLQLVFDANTTSDALRVPARVVWCTRLDDTYQIGVAFRPMPAQLVQYLLLFLRYLDDGERAERFRHEPVLDKRFG
ncbi:MAG TPA: PilZ domain-containing protein [Kofleriaceae bacterium]|nr:PilZ domain-containing protein [Kofleriaceae bacterium]